MKTKEHDTFQSIEEKITDGWKNKMDRRTVRWDQ